MQENIVIRGVRENNLKGFDLTLPRNKLIVFTGLSGSGKSSLAFDTLYAEGQRRYVESLSSYARQFLGQMEKPDVDAIDGLSPAISIDQKTTGRNPRSTVGTVTEIHDYLRLLYARVGVAHCPKCGREISKQTVDQMVDQLLALPERTRVQLLSPVIRGKKGEHLKVLEDVRRKGFVRVRVDGEVYDLAEVPPLAKTKKHTIEVVVDRLILREDIRSRLNDSLETALALSGADTRRFVFEGFLPQETKEKKEALARLKGETRTIILYEAPHRLRKTLSELKDALGEDRSVALARELTKKFEEVERMTLSEACLRFGTSDPRGEYVLVIDGKSPEQAARERAAAWETLTIPEHVAHYEAQGLSRKDAMKAAAKDRSVTKRDIYAAMLENDDRTAHI